MANVKKYTIEQISKALNDAKGFISQAARALNCNQSTIRNYIERYPELKEVLKDNRESFLDLAESKLITNVNNGDNTAIIFFLKTQGKSRGYQEKQEIELETKNAIEINFVNNESN